MSDTLGNVKGILMWGAIGFVLYEVWKQFNNPNSALNQISNAASSATCALSSGIANAWESLTFSCGIGLNGNVVLPNGNQVALNSLQVAQGCNGEVYVQYGGGTYQLAASNSCGNWPATLVS